MSFFSWLRNQTLTRVTRRATRPRSAARRFRPHCETLEDRSLLTTLFANTAADLIRDIAVANRAGGSNTIVLTNDQPYVLAAVNNTTDGANALPVIKKGDHLTIVTDGALSTILPYGATIDAAGHGRLFDVAPGASLTIEDVTLQNGLAFGSGVAAEGGAIYNRGSLDLKGVMVQNNNARGFAGAKFQKNKLGGPGSDAAGGGIWSSGSLTIENASLTSSNPTVIQANSAVGGGGGLTSVGPGAGGNAYGGGIYIAAGTASISGATIGAYSTQFGNLAQGGAGSIGGSAFGGGVYIAAGSLTMDGSTLGGSPFLGSDGNDAQGGDWIPSPAVGGNGGVGRGGGLFVANSAGGTFVTLTNDVIYQNTADGPDGGYGGGLFIGSGASVDIDQFTLLWTTTNHPDDIHGIYALLP